VKTLIDIDMNMSNKTKRLVATLKKRAMKVAFKIRYQDTGLLQVVQQVETTSSDFLCSPEWRELRLEAIKRYGNTCLKCKRVGSKRYPINIDHIKPRKYYPELSLDINNLQPLCGRCNKTKGNKVIDYRELTLGELLSKQNLTIDKENPINKYND